MENLLLAVTVGGAVLWMLVLTVPWRPWSCRERLEACDSGSVAPRPGPAGRVAAPEQRSDPAAGRQNAGGADLSDVTVLVPARDEADVIGRTVRGLTRQGAGLRVVLVDDGSTDGTATVARQAATGRPSAQASTGRRTSEPAWHHLSLTVLRAPATPGGWSGKLWALETGREEVESPLTLLLDADVELDPGLLPRLRSKLLEERLGLASLMVAPRMEGFWERLLMPAFVWFFKLLYPFRLAADPDSRVAAAAGGCVLTRTEVLREMGGLESIRGEIIDDCALARQAKAAGTRTWIGLTRSARSVRARAGLRDIWRMVARTAYAQLRYSVALLMVCTLLMAVAFWAPAIAVTGEGSAVAAGAVALGGMVAAYLPILRYYGRSPAWALALPFTATLYLAMTWSSALSHWSGRGVTWKGRSYGSGEDDAPTAGGRETPGSHAPRLLVVWKERSPRALLRAELVERGYDAVGSATPAGGLGLIRTAEERGPLRLVVLDQPTAVSRPGEWRELREALPDVPVLLVGRPTVEPPPGPWVSVLERPVTVGGVADEVERLLAARPPASAMDGADRGVRRS